MSGEAFGPPQFPPVPQTWTELDGRGFQNGQLMRKKSDSMSVSDRGTFHQRGDTLWVAVLGDEGCQPTLIGANSMPTGVPNLGGSEEGDFVQCKTALLRCDTAVTTARL